MQLKDQPTFTHNLKTYMHTEVKDTPTHTDPNRQDSLPQTQLNTHPNRNTAYRHTHRLKTHPRTQLKDTHTHKT